MNADFFNTPSPICPVCHRSGAVKPHRLIKGLLTCQHCQQRLVISCNGHYVRDPFALRHLNRELWLRQQSHPLARIWRDLTYSAQPVLLATLGSAVLLGLGLTLFQGTPTQRTNSANPLPFTRIERVNR